MTLDELIRRRGKRLVAGDYEFVEGPDGLTHLIIVNYVSLSSKGMRDGSIGDLYDLVCPCGAFAGSADTEALVIAKDLSCIRCNAA